ncbi:hypothetical protein GCM10029964_122340 [Kibdelosporangium lantanae]
MDELERRLRSALAEMAEEVPPSHNAWAEQERRLALKSRGTRVRPALLAAVAAAVVALVAIPVTLLSVRSPNPIDHASMPTVGQTSSTTPQAPPSGRTTLGDQNWDEHGYRSIPGEQLVVGPYYVDGAKGGGSLQVVAYVVARDHNPNLLLCTAVLPQWAEVNGPDQLGGASCREVPAQGKKLVRLQELVPDAADKGVYLFVADPKVSTILLRRGEDDGYREAYQLGHSQAAVVLMAARMDSPVPPKAYSARDANQVNLENG